MEKLQADFPSSSSSWSRQRLLAGDPETASSTISTTWNALKRPKQDQKYMEHNLNRSRDPKYQCRSGGAVVATSGRCAQVRVHLVPVREGPAQLRAGRERDHQAVRWARATRASRRPLVASLGCQFSRSRLLVADFDAPTGNSCFRI